MGDYVYLYGVSDDGWYVQPDMMTGEKEIIRHNTSHLLKSCNMLNRNVTDEYSSTGSDCCFLFDVVTDPTQQTNLIDVRSHPVPSNPPPLTSPSGNVPKLDIYLRRSSFEQCCLCEDDV
jgi:hypothetical protein